MHHVRHVLAGMYSLLGALGPRSYPVNGGFAEDRRNLAGDWRQVGADLRKALKAERVDRRGVKPSNPR